jgi:mRNA turnover protein 4
MPKSKRDKKISLTRTDKKPGLETKAALVEKVRGAVDSYARVFVFQVENMRNIKLKAVRESWSHSKFFIGKNRVLSKALGGSSEEEYSEGLSQVAGCLRNECGLLVTNQSEEEVVGYFSRLAEPDFARTGGLATETVTLDEGPLPDFGHSMEPQVRSNWQTCVLTPPSSCGRWGCLWP